MKLTEQQIQQLISEAIAAQQKAYAPYSHFRVGAALLGKSGRIYQGCNVENASYGLTNCAERTAIFRAVAEGERDFVALALVGDIAEPCSPCGACRQVMVEFNPDLQVIMAAPDGSYRLTTAAQLLPGFFSPRALPAGKEE
ncbi:cytidine deaminase [Carboxydocella thermautotrophica]|nr:cytidine deaminase [Carboxydocella thermautotrophica]